MADQYSYTRLMIGEALRYIEETHTYLTALKGELEGSPFLGNRFGETPEQGASSILRLIGLVAPEAEGSAHFRESAERVDLYLKSLKEAINSNIPGLVIPEPSEILSRRQARTAAVTAYAADLEKRALAAWEPMQRPQ